MLNHVCHLYWYIYVLFFKYINDFNFYWFEINGTHLAFLKIYLHCSSNSKTKLHLLFSYKFVGFFKVLKNGLIITIFGKAGNVWLHRNSIWTDLSYSILSSSFYYLFSKLLFYWNHWCIHIKRTTIWNEIMNIDVEC